MKCAGRYPQKQSTWLMEVIWTRSARTKEVKVVITEDLDSGTHQGSIALLVNFLRFNLHPSTTIHQVTAYIH